MVLIIEILTQNSNTLRQDLMPQHRSTYRLIRTLCQITIPISFLVITNNLTPVIPHGIPKDRYLRS